MNSILSSTLAALRFKHSETAIRTPDPEAANLQRRRVGFRMLAFAIFAALLGLAPSAQAQWQGRGPERSGERGPDRGPNNGCDRGDRGPDRGCPARPPENPPPPQQ